MAPRIAAHLATPRHWIATHLPHPTWEALFCGVAAIGVLLAVAGVFTPLMELIGSHGPPPAKVAHPSYFTAFNVSGEYQWRNDWPVTGGERVVITALAGVPCLALAIVWRRRSLAVLPLLLSAAALAAAFAEVDVREQSSHQDSGDGIVLYAWSLALVPVGAFLVGVASLTRLLAALVGHLRSGSRN